MKTILNYLDNMFMNLPHTEEVERAKRELASMMEDKYNELMKDGKKENEAVGIVISEFGDLDEIASALGIKSLVEEPVNDNIHIVSRQEAEDFIIQSKVASKICGFAAMLCILSPVALLFLSGLSEYQGAISEKAAAGIGITALLCMVAIGVGMFIMIGSRMEKYEYLKKESFQLEHTLIDELKEREEEIKFPTTVQIVIGVSLCILGAIPIILGGILWQDDSVLHVMTVVVLLLLVAVAVYLFITAGTNQEIYHVLRQQGEFSEHEKHRTKLIDKIAGPYWLTATLVYLIWSFTTFNWGFTWIVWPIAGVLFGLIAAICSSIQKTETIQYK